MAAAIVTLVLLAWAWLGEYDALLQVMQKVLHVLSRIAIIWWILAWFVRRKLLVSSHADSGNKALREQAVTRIFGIGQRIDISAAEQLLRRAYTNGDRFAGFMLALLASRRIHFAGTAEYVALWEDSSLAVWAAHRRRLPEARFLLCWSKSMDPPTQRVCRFMQQHLSMCCDAGIIAAWYLQGKVYKSCSLSQNDIELAMHWYEKAAAVDCALAYGGMSQILCDPEQPGFDMERGLALLNKASALGDEESAMRLARIQDEGHDGNPDPH